MPVLPPPLNTLSLVQVEIEGSGLKISSQQVPGQSRIQGTLSQNQLIRVGWGEHVFNLRRKRQADLCELEVSLDYRVPVELEVLHRETLSPKTKNQPQQNYKGILSFLYQL